MKKPPLNFWVIFVSPFLLPSCYTAPPAYQLDPISENNIWLSGKEFSQISGDDINVAAAFARSDGRHLIFDIEIANHSAKPILLDPEQFHYLPRMSLNGPASKNRIHALDPERELRKIENQLSNENAAYATVTAIDFAVTVLDLVALIAAPKHALSYENRLAQEINRSENERRHYLRISDLSARQNEWEISALRKTTLYPGEQIQGRVYFPITKNAQYLELVVPFGTGSIQLFFKQSTY